MKIWLQCLWIGFTGRLQVNTAAGHSIAFGLQISSLAIRSLRRELAAHGSAARHLIFQDAAAAQLEGTAEEDTVEEDTAGKGTAEEDTVEEDTAGKNTAEEDIAAWHYHPVGFVRQLQLCWNLT